MSGAFEMSCRLVNVFGAEAQWQATFSTAIGHASHTFATKGAAVGWLEDKTRAFLGERVVLDAPDGDGVVVAPHHTDHVVFRAPALAVRVRESSPMFSRPQDAAQVAERIHYAMRLLDEAAGLLTDVDFAGHSFAKMVQAAKGRVVTLAELSACEVFEQWPATAGVDVDHHERRLSVVPDGGVA